MTSVKISTDTIKTVLKCRCGEPLGIVSHDGRFTEYPQPAICPVCNLNSSSTIFSKLSKEYPETPYASWHDAIYALAMKKERQSDNGRKAEI